VNLLTELAQDWPVIRLSLLLCLWTTAILLLIGLPLAAWLAYSHSRLKPAIEALIALPLVLPPTVLGFYLLILLGPQGAVGSSMERLGLTHLAFSFPGLVIGSVLFSLPFAVQPLHEGLRAIGRAPLEMAAALGAGPVDRFFNVLLPLLRGSLLTAATLSFAHTLGEFGVVLMIGGSIPGETQVLSIAIYDATEALDYSRAHRLSLLLLIASFASLALLFLLRRRGTHESPA
jgi:molybdate transport system permease protein